MPRSNWKKQARPSSSSEFEKSGLHFHFVAMRAAGGSAPGLFAVSGGLLKGTIAFQEPVECNRRLGQIAEEN
jgi:hypothetical protein